jgi:hypothetical protein
MKNTFTTTLTHINGIEEIIHDEGKITLNQMAIRMKERMTFDRSIESAVIRKHDGEMVTFVQSYNAITGKWEIKRI